MESYPLFMMVGVTVLVGSALIGLPLFFSFLMGGAIITVYALGVPWPTIAQLMYNSIAKYSLLAAPFFIFSGYLMVETGMAGQLVDLFVAWVGHFRGGLSIALVLAMAFFGAVSGSVIAAIVAIGTIMTPLMVKEGYPKAFCAALAATAGLLAAFIPPSNFAIIYGSITEVPVADLFLAGIGPGLVITVLLIIVCAWVCRDMKAGRKASWKERFKAIYKAWAMLLFPVIVLGGIYAGLFTPTESGAVSGLYAILIGLTVTRNLGWGNFKKAVTRSVEATGTVWILIMAVALFSAILTYTNIPQNLVNFFIAKAVGIPMFLLMVMFVALVLGTFIEIIPNLLIMAPIIHPIGLALGIDPLQLYAAFCVAAHIGQLTPPVCVGAYAAAGALQEPITGIFKYIFPWMFSALVVANVIIAFVPSLSIWPHM